MKDISVFAVGWGEEDMSVAALKAARSAEQVLIRTEKCGCAAALTNSGIPYRSLDALYESCDDFDVLDQAVEKEVIACAQTRSVCYLTPTQQDRAAMRILRSHAEAKGDLSLYASDPCGRVSASCWETFHPDAGEDVLVYEITDKLLASEIKLRLMEYYPDDAAIYFRLPAGSVVTDTLEDLDRMEAYDHRAAALITGGAPYQKRNAVNVRDLCDIMALLREKCPWDREQTHESLRRYMLEEAYEATDAIDRAEDADLCEELGDILFQIVFPAQIALEHGAFTFKDVVTGITQKMLTRHSHVFGSETAATPEEVAVLWQQMKKKEKKYSRPEDAVLGVTTALPSLMLAEKVIGRARENGVPLPKDDGSAGAKLLSAVAESPRDAEGALRETIMKWLEQLKSKTKEQ